MAYELTVECLVAEALLRNPHVYADHYRAGVKDATTDNEPVRRFKAQSFGSRGGGVNTYGRGYLDMVSVLAKTEALP